MSIGVQDVPQDIKFAEAEDKVLEYWDKTDAFQKSLRWPTLPSSIPLRGTRCLPSLLLSL